MTVVEDYLIRLKAIDDEIDRLRKQSKDLFFEYMAYLNRLRDPQTDLCDYIRQKELDKNS